MLQRLYWLSNTFNTTNGRWEWRSRGIQRPFLPLTVLYVQRREKTRVCRDRSICCRFQYSLVLHESRQTTSIASRLHGQSWKGSKRKTFNKLFYYKLKCIMLFWFHLLDIYIHCPTTNMSHNWECRFSQFIIVVVEFLDLYYVLFWNVPNFRVDTAPIVRGSDRS